jgi:chromosome segregation ATPase
MRERVGTSMNWTSIRGGEELGEVGLMAERLDALQARLEVLERDRDSRLRDAAADIRERKLRVRELENDRNAAVRASVESRIRLEATERELDTVREQHRAVQHELSAARARLDGLADVKQQKARAEAQVVALLEDRDKIAGFVDRAATSRAWRLGHGLTSIGRRLTFRRSLGTSALGQLQARLERTPLELPSPGAGEDQQ